MKSKVACLKLNVAASISLWKTEARSKSYKLILPLIKSYVEDFILNEWH